LPVANDEIAGAQPSKTRIDGVARAASVSAAMMARPAVSPFT
jgi:hypothetical protein